MVTQVHKQQRCLRGNRGSLTIELLIAVAIVMLAIFPVSLSFLGEQKLARALYYRAVAMEIVDGEMEVLAAGYWCEFKPGVHAYTPRAESVSWLPAGRLELTLDAERLQLAWLPAKPDSGGPVVRCLKIKP
ncbi:MAG: type IV pilus modification PilV family protein [Verrucomicrobiia bacterium]